MEFANYKTQTKTQKHTRVTTRMRAHMQTLRTC